MKKTYCYEVLSFDPWMSHAKRLKKPYGFPLIIKRDGLLVSPCERLASCPAGFTCSPKCFTSKTQEMHCGHMPAELEQGLQTYTLLTHIHLHKIFFPFFS